MTLTVLHWRMWEGGSGLGELGMAAVGDINLEEGRTEGYREDAAEGAGLMSLGKD